MKKVEIEAYTHAELADKTATSGFLKIAHDGALIRAEGEYLRVSDGYHTFDELYEHRVLLFIALCRHLSKEMALPMHDDTSDIPIYSIWASVQHADGSTFGGWFVMGIGKEKGKQITYHLPARFWHEVCEFAEILECAPEYDGHTPDDVLKRLEQL